MKFYLWYRTGEYDPKVLEEFDDEAAVLNFINERAGNPDFEFKLVRGKEVVAEPVEIVKAFRFS